MMMEMFSELTARLKPQVEKLRSLITSAKEYSEQLGECVPQVVEELIVHALVCVDAKVEIVKDLVEKKEMIQARSWIVARQQEGQSGVTQPVPRVQFV